MDRETFLERRRAGIGGSDVAAILGLSKWKTPLDVYLDKRGEAEAGDETEPMRWGTLLEPVVREEYARRTGFDVECPDEMLVHPEHAFAIANVDGLADGGRRVLEVKTSRIADGWGEDGTDEIPEVYALQVQHYLWVTGLPVADVAVLIGGSDFRLYHVEADPELHELLRAAEFEFWQRVQDGNPPEPRTYDEACKLFGRPKSSAVQASDDAIEAHQRLLAVRAQQKALKSDEDALKAEIARAMGDDADTLMAGSLVLATWKQTKGRAALDTKALKGAHPDLYAEFTKTSAPTRRFLLKDVTP